MMQVSSEKYGPSIQFSSRLKFLSFRPNSPPLNRPKNTEKVNMFLVSAHLK